MGMPDYWRLPISLSNSVGDRCRPWQDIKHLAKFWVPCHRTARSVPSERRSIHDISQTLAGECPADGGGAFGAHVPKALLSIESGVRIDDQPMMSRVL